jgi:ACT domain-containing protein
MAEYVQKTEDKIEDKIIVSNDDNDSSISIRELFYSVFNKSKSNFETENSMQTLQETVIISEVDEQILEETGLTKLITPLVVDTDIADTIDDSFIEELNSVSVNLKALLEKASEANGLVISI